MDSIRSQQDYTNKRVAFYQKWQKEFPLCFEHNKDGIFPECDIGWFPLIEEILRGIEAVLEEEHKINPRLHEQDEFAGKFIIEQIKEKFGGLRFYCQTPSQSSYEKIMEIIIKGEKKAKETCEVCGKEGRLCGKSWLKTLCENHRKEGGYDVWEKEELF